MKKVLAILSMAIFFAAIVPNASAQDKKHVHKADSTKTTATTKSTPAKSTADASKKTGTSSTTSTASKTKK